MEICGVGKINRKSLPTDIASVRMISWIGLNQSSLDQEKFPYDNTTLSPIEHFLQFSVT